LKFEALRPCFLADCASTIAVVLVQGAKCAEVDLGVKNVLQSGRDIVAMVMVSMVMAVRFVVAMRVRHCLMVEFGGVAGQVVASFKTEMCGAGLEGAQR
jgi:hypothetical protein